VITGDSLAQALAGVDSAIDVATGPSADRQAATESREGMADPEHDATPGPGCHPWRRLHVLFTAPEQLFPLAVRSKLASRLMRLLVALGDLLPEIVERRVRCR
jgi:hypothetical protein